MRRTSAPFCLPRDPPSTRSANGLYIAFKKRQELNNGLKYLLGDALSIGMSGLGCRVFIYDEELIHKEAKTEWANHWAMGLEFHTDLLRTLDSSHKLSQKLRFL